MADIGGWKWLKVGGLAYVAAVDLMRRPIGIRCTGADWRHSFTLQQIPPLPECLLLMHLCPLAQRAVPNRAKPCTQVPASQAIFDRGLRPAPGAAIDLVRSSWWRLIGL